MIVAPARWPDGYSLVSPGDPEARRRNDRAFGFRRSDGKVLLGFGSEAAARLGAVFDLQREQRKATP